MTFTDAELDQLTEMLAQGDQSKIGYYGPKPYNRDGKAAIAAITYLRAQLSERDPIGAAIMRERALKAASSVVQDYKDQGGYKYADAAEYAVDRIHAIPLPTPAETLAYALELPEIKALVEAARPYIATVNDADFGRQMCEYEALVAALAALEPKP